VPERLAMELDWDRPAKALSQESVHHLRVRLLHSTKEQRGLALHIAVALDTSRSMEQDGRLERARDACLIAARDLRPGDSCSLAGYSKQVEPLFENLHFEPAAATQMERALRQLSARGVTRTDLALDWLIKVLGGGDDNQAKVAVLITDGHPTDDMGNVIDDPAELIWRVEQLRQHGVILCAIGLGHAEEFNTELLDTLSNCGRGEFIYAAEPTDLELNLSDLFAHAQQLGVCQSSLELIPLRPAIRIGAACRVRPEFSELEIPAPNNGTYQLQTGALAAGQPVDFMLRVKAPSAAFGEASGPQDVLAVEARAGKANCRSTTQLEYTSSYSRRRELNAEIDRDRRIWDMNTYTKQLQGSSNPQQTVALLESIESCAKAAGAASVAEQAAEQLTELRQTGLLTRHNATTLLANARREGERR